MLFSWGGGGTPILKGRGCMSGIFVLTPKRILKRA